MQICDHFGDQQKVDEVLLKTKVAFITHIHGDHQLGILKIMFERDNLLKEFNASNKLYVVTPTPMMGWMKMFVKDSLKFPEMVVLVPSKSLNPEDKYYYQLYDSSKYRDVEASEIMDKEDTRPLVKECLPQSKEEIDQKIKNFKPLCEKSNEMMEIVRSTMKIDQIIAVEVDHCP